MVALAATSSATSSLQATLIRSRLEVARREADQAEATVQALREDVRQAESDYDKRQNTVRDLSNQSSQQDPTYKSSLQPQRPPDAPKTQSVLRDLYSVSQALRTPPDEVLALPSGLLVTPVVNTQGQSTGRIVNVSA